MKGIHPARCFLRGPCRRAEPCAVAAASPLDVAGADAGIDAVIMPVVSRNTIKRGNKRFVKLGDKEIVLNDSSAKGVGSAWLGVRAPGFWKHRKLPLRAEPELFGQLNLVLDVSLAKNTNRIQ